VPTLKKKVGIKLYHKTLSTGMFLVPLVNWPNTPWDHQKPRIGIDECKFCNVIHPVFVMHLFFHNGMMIVTQPLIDRLLKIGWPPELSLGSEIKDPPPLAIGDGKRAQSRPQQDFANNAQQMWGTGE
jgi:hypothetical protein